ncbi:MAG: polymerase sigma-70 factor [Frankiales bacterium]|jgi:RNA polymerase sigma factor (sigma-70 family)|nr:polymerase sigma-70 factor [Frankiales bacterium]
MGAVVPDGRPSHDSRVSGTDAAQPGEAGRTARALTADDQRWIHGLASRGERHQQTCRDLHAVLHRVAKIEIAQRRGRTTIGAADLDDIACQAASDALLLVIHKAEQFRGDSRFTTWASRFVAYEVQSKVRQHVTRQSALPLSAQQQETIADPQAGPDAHAEAAELAQHVLAIADSSFSPRQRRVFSAMLRCDVPPAALAAELGLNANAVYQSVFRIRHSLREQLSQLGLVESGAARCHTGGATTVAAEGHAIQIGTRRRP